MALLKQWVCRYALSLLVLMAVSTWHEEVFGADEPVIVVLTSNTGAYKEALQGFQEAYGHTVPIYALSEGEPRIPSGTRVIVAIGGKAALYDKYPDHALLIYCLAPGTKIKPDGHPGGLLKIHTSPGPYLSISKFKELQPSLKRLVVIWAGDSIQDYIDQKKDISQRLGVEIISDRVQNPVDLPDHLRALKGKIDGIWLPADASMVTPRNFETIKGFSISNSIPFYVPSDGLVEQGALASVTGSFADIGALAGKMAGEALKGPLQTDRVFVETSHVTVSLSSAKNCNLTIPPDVLKQVEKVFP
jgi:hypothetical protein